jgi:citrate lyase subunit gamma (acyl carrier protein)
MEIKNTAMAGTLESSDVQITLSKHAAGIEIELDSPVITQFGEQIHNVVNETLAHYDITSGKVKIVDKGALDCVIKARLSAAIHRALEIKNQDTPWEV